MPQTHIYFSWYLLLLAAATVVVLCCSHSRRRRRNFKLFVCRFVYVLCSPHKRLSARRGRQAHINKFVVNVNKITILCTVITFFQHFSQLYFSKWKNKNQFDTFLSYCLEKFYISCTFHHIFHFPLLSQTPFGLLSLFSFFFFIIKFGATYLSYFYFFFSTHTKFFTDLFFAKQNRYNTSFSLCFIYFLPNRWSFCFQNNSTLIFCKNYCCYSSLLCCCIFAVLFFSLSACRKICSPRPLHRLRTVFN